MRTVLATSLAIRYTFSEVSTYMPIHTSIAALIVTASSLIVISRTASAQYVPIAGSHVQDGSGANPAASFPADFPYRVTITDLDAGTSTIYKQVAVAGPTFNWDTSLPPHAGTIAPFIYQAGPAGPVGPAVPARVTSPGTFTNTQTSAFSALVNGLSPAAEFSRMAGYCAGTWPTGACNFQNEAVTGGMTIPSTSTGFAGAAVAAYTNQDSSTTNGVAFFGSAYAGSGVSGGNGAPGGLWGINTVAICDFGCTAGISGYEDDINVNGSPASVYGVIVTGNPNASGTLPAIASGYYLTKVASNPWHYGFNTANGAALDFASVGATASTANSPSQDFLFTSFNSHGAVQNSRLYQDPNGNLIWASAGAPFPGVVANVNTQNFFVQNQSLLNPNLATAVVSQPAPALRFLSNVWNGTASVSDTVYIQPQLGTGANPYEVVLFSHIGQTTGPVTWQFGQPVIAPMYQETLTTPASSSANCTAGQFTDDANYHYVCTATNTWKRVALSTF